MRWSENGSQCAVQLLQRRSLSVPCFAAEEPVPANLSKDTNVGRYGCLDSRTVWTRGGCAGSFSCHRSRGVGLAIANPATLKSYGATAQCGKSSDRNRPDFLMACPCNIRPPRARSIANETTDQELVPRGAPSGVCRMPWDRFGPRANATHTGSARVRAVGIKNNRGFIGNKLFVIAAGVALAEKLRLPLQIPWKTTSLTLWRKGFPCLRSTRAIHRMRRDRLDLVYPFGTQNGSNMQDLSLWGSADASGIPRGRPRPSKWRTLMQAAFRPVAGTSQRMAPPPMADDLVVHFRDLRDCNGWQAKRGGARSTYHVSAINRWLYRLDDLFAPPSDFYRAIVRAHVQRYQQATVWIVCQPCDRKHPTMSALRKEWPSRVRFLTQHHDAATCASAANCQSAVLDFLWLMSARHLVLSPSTFGWWAAFLSTTATTIHYPVHPSFSPFGATNWCQIVPEDDVRYVFHDAWLAATWRGGGTTGSEARRRCDVYMRACLHARVCATNQSSANAARKLPLAPIDR